MTRPRKVALVGTSSTGKSSVFALCRQTLENRCDIAFVEESARKFFQLQPHAPHLSYATQSHLQQLTLQDERRALAKNPRIILCDRSVLDAIVYTDAGLDAEGARLLQVSAADWLRTYTVFLLLDPAGAPYVPDHIRTETREGRLAVHGLYLEWLQRLALPYEVIAGSLAHRVERTLHHLDSCP